MVRSATGQAGWSSGQGPASRGRVPPKKPDAQGWRGTPAGFNSKLKKQCSKLETEWNHNQKQQFVRMQFTQQTFVKSQLYQALS